MEDIASDQDNPSNVTVTLTAARVSVLPRTIQQIFVANEFASLDLKTAYYTIKLNSEYYVADNPLPFGLKRFEKPTTLH